MNLFKRLRPVTHPNKNIRDEDARRINWALFNGEFEVALRLIATLMSEAGQQVSEETVADVLSLVPQADLEGGPLPGRRSQLN
ncbi:hypothetical protein [Roseibium sediminicola]|uniref:Uncharacterized protein n=1 Tax=Roseibium sediminicola TaxID=2933272 RepID=A0ABT0H2W4_9HYPH|nr:hypothetical protein [Roseibium sp. CAU 1639]MCK7616027.1 hypothetical protein [Roseibium sp. CAU 1639]